jgi:dipeptidyl aminopeptidase/acylaminoacyl peptidase
VTEPTPYGSWPSSIGFDALVAGKLRLGAAFIDGEDTYWVEGRPDEGGRQVVVRLGADGMQTDMTAPGVNARSRVHEYGGGAYAVHRGIVYYSDFSDGGLYRQTTPGVAEPVTPEGASRYADVVFDAQRARLICVREDHSDTSREAVNSLVEIRLAGALPVEPVTMVAGNDFYSSPRLSPDGTRLCWLTWSHPNMPWDGTELWVANVATDGSLADPELVAGGPDESVFQPEWSPEGVLYFVSDRTGWWNIHWWQDGETEILAQRDEEFGEPQWVFGLSRYGFDAQGGVVCAVTAAGHDRLYRWDPDVRDLVELESPFTEIAQIAVFGDVALVRGASAREGWSLRRLDIPTGTWTLLREGSTWRPDAAALSDPEPIEFPTTNGLTAFGIFYPPRNGELRGPDGEMPPLVVTSHGGPTSSADTALDPAIQILTSRGIAVLDVDYGGSSGYGRAYRERLNGQWGVVDVDDCVNGALFLAEQGRVDRGRMAIEGGSASGYTTLCALTMRDTFGAGASHFGIGDLETFVHDTHKFESRYLDRLVGPFPERQDLYRERSPIHHTDGLNAPVIILQGLDDRVVPPSQAQQFVDAMEAKGLPYAYLAFEGEDHGFRKAENIVRSNGAVLSFYSQIFGFSLADPVEPVPIQNL